MALTQITFETARNYKMQFGKHQGETLDEIAASDEGLKYLDWLAGSPNLRDYVRTALVVYLADPSIKKELETLLAQ